MGNVVPFKAPFSIGYEGRALTFVVGFSWAIHELHNLRALPLPPKLSSRLETVSKKMDVILPFLGAVDEAIQMMERHASLLVEAIQDGGTGTFVHDSVEAPLTVHSLVLRRCATLSIQDFRFTSTLSAALPQDNTAIVCGETDSGLICRLVGAVRS